MANTALCAAEIGTARAKEARYALLWAVQAHAAKTIDAAVMLGVPTVCMLAGMPIERVHLHAPLKPGKIIAVGRNYVEHAKERGVDVPEIPLIFFKPPSSVIGPEETIILPPQSTRVDHESELAVVIGKAGRWIQAEKAMEHVLGYTIANDVTARDLQQRDGQWTRGKGFDTFCPLGPWIETELDPADTILRCRVNGEMRQMGSTREMVFTVPQLIAFISSVMTGLSMAGIGYLPGRRQAVQFLSLPIDRPQPRIRLAQVERQQRGIAPVRGGFGGLRSRADGLQRCKDRDRVLGARSAGGRRPRWWQ